MIGRLIEDQKIDGFEEELDHTQTDTLTARKDFDLLLSVFATKHEGAEKVRDLFANFADSNIVDGLIDGCFFVKQRRGVLREIAYLHVVANGEFASVSNLVHNGFDHGGFSFAILSDESNLLATLNHEGSVMEDAIIFL